MSRDEKFHPGWKMTWPQFGAYWQLRDQVCAKMGITSSAEKEDMRKIVHIRAFGFAISAKEIDHLKGFDAYKGACLAILQPDNLAAQKIQLEMPLTRLRFRIRELADEGKINSLVRSDRWKKDCLEDLTEQELTDLRNTMMDRQVEDRKPGTLAGRRARARARQPATEIDRSLIPF